jgi:steroid 5-alpha reductase family enzyme
MIYLLLGYLAFHFTLMAAILMRNGLLEAWLVSVGIVFGAVLAMMCLVFLVAKRIRRYDLVDAAWGWAFMTAALASYLLQAGSFKEFDLPLLVTILVWIWGIRLSTHIIRRIRATKTEDPRYVELRSKWKGNVSWNVFLRIYVVQAFLATLIAMPVIHVNLFFDFRPADFGILTYVGLGMWLLGFLIESVADRQLQRFVKLPENKGKIMDRGLWKYSRHPNYFGELTQWWGILVICLGVQVGWFGIVGPLVLTYLILFVSGIPLNEKRFEGREGWSEYKRRTSVIIPLPTRQ